jgi:glucose dehydrogenase
MFRAYNKKSGDIVWEIELEAGTSGPPISYLHDGEQYILVAIGDREYSPELVAFKLP